MSDGGAAGPITERAAGVVLCHVAHDGGGTARRYLLLQAADSDHGWTPPKGRLEPNESTRDAAVRETSEESGFDIGTHYDLCDQFNYAIRYTARNKHKEVVYYAGIVNESVRSIEPRLSHEHMAHRWCSVEQIDALVKPSTGDAIKAADQFIAATARR